jgi:hypothetical protein
MSMGQSNAAFVFSRRQREQPEGMATSGTFSAVCVPVVLPNASGNGIRQIIPRTAFSEIDGASPTGILLTAVTLFRSIATHIVWNETLRSAYEKPLRSFQKNSG